jgi:hypothetical protein
MLVKMFIRGGIQEPFDVTTVEYTWETKDHHEELQNCWCYEKCLICCCGLAQLFDLKHILMFTIATTVTNDSTLLWLALLMCLSLVTNVSFDKMFTNGTRVHVVHMVTFESMLTHVAKIPAATMVNSDTDGNISNQYYQFCNHRNPGIW